MSKGQERQCKANKKEVQACDAVMEKIKTHEKGIGPEKEFVKTFFDTGNDHAFNFQYLKAWHDFLKNEPFNIEQILKNEQSSIYDFVNSPDNAYLRTDIKAGGKNTSYSLESVRDLNQLILLTEKHLIELMNKADQKDYDAFEKGFNAFRLYYSFLSLLQIERMKRKIKNKETESIYHDVFWLGCFRGLRSNFLFLFPREARDVFASLKSSVTMKQRWDPLRKFKEDAIEIAETQWSIEDEFSNHNKMAKIIYEALKPDHVKLRKKLIDSYCKKVNAKNKELRRKAAEKKADELLLKTIRKAILPVAEECGRIKNCNLVWGIKGSKKT